MKRSGLLLIGVGAMIGLAVVAAGQAAQGPDRIVIDGGVSGKVPFPHAQHQDRVGDCNVCHAVFPQETEAIRKMKTQGKLQPKKVMNLQCIKCHKQAKRDGKPHGPLTCTSCHVK